MNISSFFIKNNALLILLTLFFGIGGLFAFQNLNRNEDPGFKIRTASIITEAEGFNAEKTDKFITRQIENEIFAMEEIEDIREESIQGRSIIYADLYENYKNLQPIYDRLRRKVELSKANLPKGVIPVVNDEFADVFGVLIGVSKNNASYENLYDSAILIRNELLKLKQKGKVEIFGRQKEVLYLYLKNSYFSNLKLTPEKMKYFIDSSNPTGLSGLISTSLNSVGIEPLNTINNKEALENTTLNINNTPLFVKDVFKIEKTTKKPNSRLVRSNGKDALVIGVSMKNDGNILKFGKEVKDVVYKMQKKYPNLNIEILALQSDYVKKLTDKFTSSLFESVLSVILIVLAILGIKTGIITGAIILITILSVFLTMDFLNIGLDKISLSALIISLGILVDNSIVIAQGCLNSGIKNIKEHIMSVAKKFQLPLFVVTITTSLSFLPVFIANSTVGEYASNLFKVVFITLVFSWFYSVSLLPYLMLKFGYKDIGKKRELFLIKFLKKAVEKAFEIPKTILLSSISLFIFSLFIFMFVPKIFFPDSDRNMFEIRLNLKNGVSFEETKNAVIKVEDYIKNQKDIVNFSSYIGTSAPRYVLSASPEADRVNFGMVLVSTKTYKTVEKNIIEIKDFINKNLPNVQAVVRKIPLGPPVDAPVEIRIKDNNIKNLFYFSNIISDELSKIDGVYLVKNNWGDFSLEYLVKVNENASISAGITPFGLFSWLDMVYNGETISSYYRGDVLVDIVLKGEEDFINNLDNLNYVSIYSPSKDKIIPIKQIAAISPGFTYSKILRRNNSYVLTVQAWIDDTTTADKVSKVMERKLDKVKNLDYEFGGTIEKSKKGNNSVIEKVPVAFGIILLILTAYFNSIKKPVLIGVCAIMALTGANLGLFITGGNFGFMTFLGYICLVGICTNNGVILINEIKGGSKEEILEAAKSRIEPVLLTCLTTIAGMLPLWVKNDPMFSTLAVAIIFGLISSIIITIFVLPLFYYLKVQASQLPAQ